MNEQRPRPNDPDKVRGLYGKFHVERVIETPRHDDCEYFVLDMMHDAFALVALAAYAEACADEYPLLADDLRFRWLEDTA